MQVQLDILLGLAPAGADSAGAPKGQRSVEPGMLTCADYSSAALAPAGAELAAALARTKVAETCVTALQDISCSSVCNTSPPGSKGACVGSAFGTQPPWRPASPTKTSPQKQQQQWQQWQQHQAAGCSSTSRAHTRTPSPTRQLGRQQQGAVLPVLQCVRCGQQEGAGMGPCCFHPGLVAAPGPLMYGQEWHTCR
jgi:hypothetical protein